MCNLSQVDASNRCQYRSAVTNADAVVVGVDPGGEVDHLNEAGDAQQGDQILGLRRGRRCLKVRVEKLRGELVVRTPEIGKCRNLMD